MKMKRTVVKTLLACGTSIMLSAAVQAQSPSPSPSASPGGWLDHRHHHGGGILEHLTYALGLSGTQQAEVAQILEQAKPQFEQIQKNAQEQRKTEVESVASQITPLLTGTQQAKFSEMVQKFENNAGAGRGQSGGRGAPLSPDRVLQRMTTQLGLTSDQQNQIKPILEAAHTQVQSVLQNTSLTKEEKVSQVKEAVQAARGQIKGILTPAQQQQVEELKAKFHRRWQGWNGLPSASPSPSASGTTSA